MIINNTLHLGSTLHLRMSTEVTGINSSANQLSEEGELYYLHCTVGSLW